MSEQFRLPSHFYNHRLRVAVAGCGGTGSQILTGLARLDTCLRGLDHPGLEVTAFDPDRVTDSNVGRQLFYPADVGRYKSDVLIHRLNMCFGLNWKSVPEVFASRSDELSRGADFLIGCVDSSRARMILDEAVHDMGIPYWLDIGNEDVWGQVILGEPLAEDRLSLPTVLDMFPDIRNKVNVDEGPSCSLAESLSRQGAFVNQMVATVALDALWQIFRSGEIDRFAWFVNLKDGRMTSLKATADVLDRYQPPRRAA